MPIPSSTNDTSEAQVLVEIVYSFIVNYIHQQGYSPSLREIAAGCTIGRSTASRYVDKLEAQQRVIRDEGKARSIRLLDAD